jgi:hypothetical protein
MPHQRCPDRDLLVDVALRGAAGESHAPSDHFRDCAVCGEEIASIRRSAESVWLAADAAAAAGTCLDDVDIAAVADGTAGAERDRAVAHLATCPSCRHRLATISRLLRDEGITRERRHLEASGQRLKWRTVAVGIGAAASLAGAFVAGGLLRTGLDTGSGSDGAESTHRDGVITSTVAPRILLPASAAATPDSLRWTSVPYADRYQVLVFGREGTLVWEPQTTDTAIALPAAVTGTPATYIWKVEARTGWDRWVASEWARFTVQPQEGGL